MRRHDGGVKLTVPSVYERTQDERHAKQDAGAGGGGRVGAIGRKGGEDDVEEGEDEREVGRENGEAKDLRAGQGHRGVDVGCCSE